MRHLERLELRGRLTARRLECVGVRHALRLKLRARRQACRINCIGVRAPVHRMLSRCLAMCCLERVELRGRLAARRVELFHCGALGEFNRLDRLRVGAELRLQLRRGLASHCLHRRFEHSARRLLRCVVFALPLRLD